MWELRELTFQLPSRQMTYFSGIATSPWALRQLGARSQGHAVTAERDSSKRMAQECERDVGLLGCGCEGDVYTVYRGVCVECVWCECVCVNLCKCRGNVSVCVVCMCTNGVSVHGSLCKCMGCVCLLEYQVGCWLTWNLEVTISTKQKYKAPEDSECSSLFPKIGTQWALGF